MINRRNFLQHTGGIASVAAASATFGQTILANAEELSKDRKAAILIWLGGGPPTIDMWDLKSNSETGGPFKPINTTGDFQISEHLPILATLGSDFSLVRTMMTREADHERGTYYVHTGYKPDPTMKHPSLGSIVAYELGQSRTDLEIPSFFSVNTDSIGGGFLGTSWNPFVVTSNGDIKNLGGSIDQRRLSALSVIENEFIKTNRGSMPMDHKKLLEKTIRLNTSPQMSALKPTNEPQFVLDAYGDTAFGRSALMARRLIQQGVPFIEVGFGGWDLHQDVHETLTTKLPELDKVVSTLIRDLKRLDMWDNVAIIMMGEFGRTPNINSDAGRDHWAKTWTAFLSGGLIKGGQAIGSTTEDGRDIKDGLAYSSEDIVATVCSSLKIDMQKNYTSNSGRPMKIANSGKIIEQLI